MTCYSVGVSVTFLCCQRADGIAIASFGSRFPCRLTRAPLSKKCTFMISNMGYQNIGIDRKFIELMLWSVLRFPVKALLLSVRDQRPPEIFPRNADCIWSTS